MAVTGRQKLYVYLAPQEEMMASAVATFSRANRRASATRSSPRAADTPWAIVFQWPKAKEVPVASFQKKAICVWSAVRVVLSTRPRLLTSLKAAAYSALPSAGGAPGRNCAPSDIAKGVTSGH